MTAFERHRTNVDDLDADEYERWLERGNGMVRPRRESFVPKAEDFAKAATVTTRGFDDPSTKATSERLAAAWPGAKPPPPPVYPQWLLDRCERVTVRVDLESSMRSNGIVARGDLAAYARVNGLIFTDEPPRRTEMPERYLTRFEATMLKLPEPQATAEVTGAQVASVLLAGVKPVGSGHEYAKYALERTFATRLRRQYGPLRDDAWTFDVQRVASGYIGRAWVRPDVPAADLLADRFLAAQARIDRRLMQQAWNPQPRPGASILGDHGRTEPASLDP